MPTGRVKFFNADRGFGFILPGHELVRAAKGLR
jgi:cold shock CspA family protein